MKPRVASSEVAHREDREIVGLGSAVGELLCRRGDASQELLERLPRATPQGGFQPLFAEQILGVIGGLRQTIGVQK